MELYYSLLLLTIPLSIIFTLIKRKLRLYSIPGPSLASFTDLWRWYRQNTTPFQFFLQDLHKRYGSIVRLGPNTVSFSDPTVITSIYTSHGEFRKADSYQTLRSVSNGKVQGSVIDLQDEELVAQVKRAVGSVFAVKNVLDYENDVDNTWNLLLQSMRKSSTFDLYSISSQFQADFLFRVAFSEESHYLETDGDSDDLSTKGRVIHWMKWQAMPFLERLVYKTPILMRYFKTNPGPLWVQMAKQKLQSRLAGEQCSGSRSDLLSRYIQGGEKRGDNLPTEVIPLMVSSTVSAGFDTTAFTITTVIYFLCKNPSAMQKLRDEIKAANVSSPPRFQEIQQLKYLAAVIKESMRLYPAVQVLLERTVPAGGATLCGKVFPAGTVVGCNPMVTHRNPEFYGRDAEYFRPERWLVDDTQKVLAMERAALGFGSGKRICLGRHLAEMEIKKVVPAMVMSFDIELVDPNYIMEPRNRYFSFPKPVWMKVSERK